MSAQVSINVGALDSTVGKMAPRALYIDSEARADGFAIVVRGRDIALAGSTSKQRDIPLVFNDESGAHREFTIATISGAGAQERADSLVSALRAFHAVERDASGAPIYRGLAERLGADAEFALLALIVGQSIGVAPYCAMSSRSVGSFHESKAARTAAREAQKQAAAKATAVAMVSAQPDKLVAAMSAEDMEGMLAAIQARRASLAK